MSASAQTAIVRIEAIGQGQIPEETASVIEVRAAMAARADAVFDRREMARRLTIIDCEIDEERADARG